MHKPGSPYNEGGVSVEVSNNGVDFSTSGVEFAYVEGVVIDHVTPVLGPSSGGTTIFFTLSHRTSVEPSFDVISCEFGNFVEVTAVYENISVRGETVCSCVTPALSSISQNIEDVGDESIYVEVIVNGSMKAERAAFTLDSLECQ